MKKLFALDLEMNQPSRNIIQIGAAVGFGSDLIKFSRVVNPLETITPEIEKLTGVTNKRVHEEGVWIKQAYDDLVKFYIDNGPYDCPNPLTWGGGDTETLHYQIERVAGFSDNAWPFGRRHLDVKTIYIAWRMAQDEKLQGGLAKALTKLDLNFDGRKHDAADDAANTIRVYCRLLEKFA